jgi:hypothetical protein
MTCVREQVNVRTNSGSSRLRTTSGALVETLVVTTQRTVSCSPSTPGPQADRGQMAGRRWSESFMGFASGIAGYRSSFFGVGTAKVARAPRAGTCTGYLASSFCRHIASRNLKRAILESRKRPCSYALQGSELQCATLGFYLCKRHCFERT